MGGRYIDHIPYEGLANENAEKLSSEGWESKATEEVREARLQSSRQA